MNSDEMKPRITVEDLLRLKRTERPAPEFWAQFEQELRAKQLAAIVEKKPWWCAVPRLYVFVLRNRLYLGSASAAMLAAGVGLRIYSASAAGMAAPASYAAQTAFAAPAVAETAALPAAPVLVAAAPAAPEPVRLARAAAHPLSSQPSQVLPLITMTEQVPQSAPADRFATLTRSMAVNLASAEAAAAQVGRTLAGDDHAFDTRLVPVSSPVTEPLAQMASPAEERRSRLRDAEAFSAMAGSSSLVLPAIERRVSRLDDRPDSDLGRYNLTPS